MWSFTTSFTTIFIKLNIIIVFISISTYFNIQNQRFKAMVNNLLLLEHCYRIINVFMSHFYNKNLIITNRKPLKTNKNLITQEKILLKSQTLDPRQQPSFGQVGGLVHQGTIRGQPNFMLGPGKRASRPAGQRTSPQPTCLILRNFEGIYQTRKT